MGALEKPIVVNIKNLIGKLTIVSTGASSDISAVVEQTLQNVIAGAQSDLNQGQDKQE